MSSDKDLYWELKNGGTEKGDKVAAPGGVDYLPCKRLRSSGSYTGDESVNSAETSPKKAKVQVIKLKIDLFYDPCLIFRMIVPLSCLRKFRTTTRIMVTVNLRTPVIKLKMMMISVIVSSKTLKVTTQQLKT